jgi:hypothetical protein
VALAKIGNMLFWLKPILLFAIPLAEANGNDGIILNLPKFKIKHPKFEIHKHAFHRTNNPSTNLAPAQGYIVSGRIHA